MKSTASSFALALLLLGCPSTSSTSPSTSAPATAEAAAPSTAATTSSAPVPSAAASAESIAPGAVSASNAFGVELYKRLKGSPGNLTISPTSVATALAMTCGGARAATAAELGKVLRFDCAGRSGMKTASALSSSLESTPGVKLAVANRLFGEKTYGFKPAFIEATRSAFGAPLETVDFKKEFEPARGLINKWVADKTEQRIKDLLPKGALDDKTRLVLVNAIYFLGDWAQQFDEAHTAPSPFTLLGGKQVSVPTMNRTESFAIADVDDVTLVELPYKDRGASMVLIVPKDVASFAKLESTLDGAFVERAISKLAPGERIALSMPKFVLEPRAPLTLKAPLIAMGLSTLFSENADLGEIAEPKDPREKLLVSEVFHKTFVRVDEKGTEAAAATAVVAKAGGGPAKVRELKVDRPFLFVIRHKRSGAMLFLGRVTDPRGES